MELIKEIYYISKLNKTKNLRKHLFKNKVPENNE